MHEKISDIDIASEEPKTCSDVNRIPDGFERLGSKLDKSYCLANCCVNCIHSEIIIHQDMTESYCNINRDSPPKVDYRANDPNEDVIFETRRAWEVGHTVELYGTCKHHDRMLDK